MKHAPLTVAEARAILRADDALARTHAVRLSAGATFGDQEREAWGALVESAADRMAAWAGTKREATASQIVEPDRYPGGNELGFQTLALEAAAAASTSASLDTESQALRVGIETIVHTFGTNSAEWAQQLVALLDRVPPAQRTS